MSTEFCNKCQAGYKDKDGVCARCDGVAPAPQENQLTEETK